jgi:hypothetical protein
MKFSSLFRGVYCDKNELLPPSEWGLAAKDIHV